MPEMHVRQLASTYSGCGPDTKNKERVQKLKERRRFTMYLTKRTR